jgi:hypothetical protein
VGALLFGEQEFLTEHFWMMLQSLGFYPLSTNFSNSVSGVTLGNDDEKHKVKPRRRLQNTFSLSLSLSTLFWILNTREMKVRSQFKSGSHPTPPTSSTIHHNTKSQSFSLAALTENFRLYSKGFLFSI